jgi:Protein of unknown function (DUF2997)
VPDDCLFPIPVHLCFPPSMAIETLEFTIYPDGRVEEKVTGVTGSSCTKVTAEIEEAIGRVLSHQTTEEFFAQENSQTASNSNLTAW